MVSSVTSDSATFAALREPFENRPRIQSFERLAQTDDALAVRVTSRTAGEFDDRLMVRVGESANQPVTLAAGGERFTFASHAFVRRSGQNVTVRGDLREMILRVGDAGGEPSSSGRGCAAELLAVGVVFNACSTQ